MAKSQRISVHAPVRPTHQVDNFHRRMLSANSKVLAVMIKRLAAFCAVRASLGESSKAPMKTFVGRGGADDTAAQNY